MAHQGASQDNVLCFYRSPGDFINCYPINACNGLNILHKYRFTSLFSTINEYGVDTRQTF